MNRIDLYWRTHFGLDDELDRPGVHVVPHVRYPGDDLAFVFVRGEAAVVSVARSRVQSTRKRIRRVEVTHSSIPPTLAP